MGNVGYVEMELKLKSFPILNVFFTMLVWFMEKNKEFLGGGENDSQKANQLEESSKLNHSESGHDEDHEKTLQQDLNLSTSSIEIEDLIKSDDDCNGALETIDLKDLIGNPEI